MNRIYQGKITEVKIPKSKDGQPEPLADEFQRFVVPRFCHASIEEESRWGEYLDWLTQRLVKMNQVLRPIVKGLP